MDIVVAPTPAALAELTARSIARRLRSAIRLRGRASLAISGGSTPRLMLELLGRLPLPWEQVDVYQVDERVAPDGDPARNAALLDLLPAPRRNVHPMPVTSRDLRAAARQYASALPDRIDVVHLGMGDDGHTASWPPGDAVVDSTSTVDVCGSYNGHVRLTLTPRAVNSGRWRIVQVAGASKATMVRRWIDGDHALPIALVRRTGTTAALDAESSRLLASVAG